MPGTATLELDHAVKDLFAAHPYVVTFASESTDVWVFDDASTLQHYTRLDRTLPHPGGLIPILDDDLGLLAIMTFSNPGAPELCVFSLEYGTLLRTLLLYGDLANSVPCYHAGRALISTQYNDKSELFLLDVAGDGWILGTAQLPPNLPQTASLNSVHLETNGDDITIVGAACAFPGQAENITLLLWRGIPPDGDGDQPASHLVLPLRMPDADAVSIESSTSLGTSAFVFSAYESCSDAIDTKSSRLSTVRAIDITSDGLALRWEVPPESIYGRVTELVHVPAANAVFAIGSQNAREDAGESIMLTFIAVLDDQTGALRMRQDIPSAALSACRVVHGKVVCVWKNGEVSVAGVSEFEQRGLPMEQEDAVRQAGVLDGAVVLLDSSGDIAVKSW